MVFVYVPHHRRRNAVVPTGRTYKEATSGGSGRATNARVSPLGETAMSDWFRPYTGMRNWKASVSTGLRK